MSLLLFLFYWIAIPVLVISAAAWLWRRMDSLAARGLVAVACLATLSGLLWLAVGEKWLADRQVRELCAKDGGVRVYEEVTLPLDRFNQLGQPNFRIPITPYDKLDEGDDYYLIWEISHIKLGNPNIDRNNFKVIRRIDKKLLAESVSYVRGGGDLPGPWANSSYTCPDKNTELPLLQKTFVNSNSGRLK